MKRLVLSLFLLFTFVAAPALAQQAAGDLATAERRLLLVTEQMGAANVNDERLVGLRGELEKLSRSLIEFGVSFRPELGKINDRLAELGAAPKEGDAPEAAVIADERASLLARKIAINGELAAAERLSVRINDALGRIGDMRRDLFANTLLQRTDATGVFQQSTWRDFLADSEKARRAIATRLQFVWNFRKIPLLAAVGISAGMFLLVWLVFRRAFAPLLAPPGASSGSYFSRVSFAFWTTLIPAAAFAAGLSFTYGAMSYFGIFAGLSMEIVRALLVSLAAFHFIRRLVFAVFAPGRPSLRLAPFTDRAAIWLAVLATAMAGVHVVDLLFSWIADALNTPLAVTVAENLAASVLIGFLLVQIALVKPFLDPQTGKPRPWPAILRAPMLALAAFVIFAAVAGYIGLARFVAAQIVVTGAIVATMLIGFQTGRALSRDGAMEASALGRYLSTRWDLGETALFQIGLLLRFSIYLLVAFIGVPLIALQWGFRLADVMSAAYWVFTDLEIGAIRISLVAILLGVVLFIAGYIATRKFQNWLDQGVLVKSKVDAGVRNSIRTVAGYIGIGFAALIGISAAGFDLSNLAIVAGALSLGIGFGLQNIVSNFVSGLILLAERPFKVGDWIVAGTTTGMVKKISVRATEIETFQKQTVILPNSDLINSAVGNWTHRNRLGRIDIAVGVAYGSKPREVYDLLLELAAADPSVLKVPAPMAIFLGFGDSALSFELRVHIADVMESLVVGTWLRFAIFDALAARGIDIPYPQRDINLKTGDLETLIERFVGRTATPPETAAAQPETALQAAIPPVSAAPSAKRRARKSAAPDPAAG